MLGDLSSGDLIGRRQLNQINWRPRSDHIVRVRPGRLAQSMIFLQLDHEVLGSNWGTWVHLVPEWNGTWKAWELMSLKKQISLVREEGWLVLEYQIIWSTDFGEISKKPKNRDSRWSRPTHLPHCPETSVSKEQVDSVDDVDQIVNPKELSMHAIQASDEIGQVHLFESIAELENEFLITILPCEES